MTGVKISALPAVTTLTGAELIPIVQNGVTSRTTATLVAGSTVTPKWYGAAGDGVTDDTASLNLFFAAVAAGAHGYIPVGTYKFTAALTAIVGNKISVSGAGRGAVLQYAGAGTTATLLTFGDGTAYNRLSVSGFTVESSTTMSAGYALRVRAYQHSTVDIWCGDEFSQGWKLYGGAWFDSCTVVDLMGSRFYATNEGYKWSNGVELNNGTAFVKMATSSAAAQGTGIHIAGGCGGWNGMSLDLLFADIGVLVDTSETGTKNSQIFMGCAKVDTCKTAGVKLNDALGTSLIFQMQDAWIASTSVGDGLWIANWHNGVVDLDGGIIHNNAGDGIQIDDATPTYFLSDGLRISSNGGWGVNASTPVSIFSNCRPTSNSSGTFQGNVTTAPIVSPSSAANTIKGNNTGSTADTADLSLSNVRGMLAVGAINFSATVDFNVANTDTQIAIALPTGFTRYMVASCRISGPSASLSTATAGLFTAAAGGGAVIVTAASAITVTATGGGTLNNAQSMTIAGLGATTYGAGSATLFFRVANAQGSAATGTVTIQINPLP